MVLGRLCTEAARILRGKHKPIYAPHIDTGDHVIIVNASKIVMTSGKAERTMVIHRHSGYPGGLKSETYAGSTPASPQRRCASSVKWHAAEGTARTPAC
jgi:large subunit ribosomal protein L13